ncbi:MAG: hypothetical protein JNK82_30820 [Myxococcaceae bacterium]|nr:hypothetical protein [Myxococcaceae bacterium]
MAANVRELGVIKVASPCKRDWEKMTGDARVRFCADCQLNVYNLSELTTDEAHQLIREKEGRLCVRFFSRADGTLITRDCPVGVRTKRKKLIAAGAAAVSMSLAALAFSVTELFAEAPSESCGELTPIEPTVPAEVTEAAKNDKTPAKPEDTEWMERRRNQLGPREKSPQQRYHTMGVIRLTRDPADEKKTD